MAQLVAHHTGSVGVTGSNPVSSTFEPPRRFLRRGGSAFTPPVHSGGGLHWSVVNWDEGVRKNMNIGWVELLITISVILLLLAPIVVVAVLGSKLNTTLTLLNERLRHLPQARLDEGNTVDHRVDHVD